MVMERQSKGGQDWLKGWIRVFFPFFFFFLSNRDGSSCEDSARRREQMCCSLFFDRDRSEGVGLAKDSESIQFDERNIFLTFPSFFSSLPKNRSEYGERGIFHGVKDWLTTEITSIINYHGFHKTGEANLEGRIDGLLITPTFTTTPA